MRNKILFALIFIILIAKVYSLELIPITQNNKEGEIFIGKIEANLKKNLLKDEIKIYEGRREVYFEKEVYRYNNTTFFYFALPKEGNFTILVESILYFENNSLKEGKINYSLIVGKKENKTLFIIPGVLAGNNLSLFLSNKGNEELEITIDNDKYSLKENELKKIEIKPKANFFYLDVKSYKTFSIPVIYFGEIKTETKNQTINKTENDRNESINLTNNESKENITNLEISPENFEDYLLVNETKTFFLAMKNPSEKNISLNLSSEIKGLNFSKEEYLLPFEEKNLTIFYLPEKTGFFKGNLTIKFENQTKEILFKIYVLNNSDEIEEIINVGNDTENVLQKSCSERNGKICSSNTDCIGGERVYIYGEGLCCVNGECKKVDEEPTDYKGKIIGLVLLILGAIIVYILWKKFKGVKPQPKF